VAGREGLVACPSNQDRLPTRNMGSLCFRQDICNKENKRRKSQKGLIKKTQAKIK
jgi:hypothetical protein